MNSLAYAEMRLILARVLYNFDLQPVDENNHWMDQRTYTLWEKRPLDVLLKKR
jgi:cytochrome P450